MTPIPQKLRKLIAADDFYKTCALFGQHGHECEGRVTMEHSIIFGGKQLQELWAIVPLCAAGHGVDNFQDAASTTKDLRIWVALNRATDQELQTISKVENYKRTRERLNKIFGEYVHKVPSALDQKAQESAQTKRGWYPISKIDEERIEKLRRFNHHIGNNLSIFQQISTCIEDQYLSIKDHLSEQEPDLYKALGFDK